MKPRFLPRLQLVVSLHAGGQATSLKSKHANTWIMHGANGPALVAKRISHLEPLRILY